MQQVAGFTDHRTQANGIDVHYLEWGGTSAPPLVLLHGLTGHAHIWDHMAPDLARSYHVFVPDQRGHGDTAHAATYRTQDFTGDLAALVRHWQLDRFVLVGLSMGGHNAMAYAAANPERVTHLCVIDIPPRLDWKNTPDYADAARVAREGHTPYPDFDAAFADARKGNTTAPDENLRYRTEHNTIKQSDGALLLKYDAKVRANWEPADLWPELPKITAPTLIVRAGLNAYLPEKTAQRMRDAIAAEATVVEVATSGHSVPTDKPELLAPLLLDWLAKTPAS